MWKIEGLCADFGVKVGTSSNESIERNLSIAEEFFAICMNFEDAAALNEYSVHVMKIRFVFQT